MLVERTKYWGYLPGPFGERNLYHLRNIYLWDQESTNQYHSTVERKSASQASRPRKRKVDWQSSRRFIQFYVIVIVNIHSREISDWPKNGLPWLWTISYFSYNFRLVLKCSDYGLWLILTTSEETRRFSDCLQTTYTSSVKVHLVLPGVYKLSTRW